MDVINKYRALYCIITASEMVEGDCTSQVIAHIATKLIYRITLKTRSTKNEKSINLLIKTS